MGWFSSTRNNTVYCKGWFSSTRNNTVYCKPDKVFVVSLQSALTDNATS